MNTVYNPKRIKQSRTPLASKLRADAIGLILALIGVVFGLRTGNLNLLVASISFAVFMPFFTGVIFRIFYPWRFSDDEIYEEGDRVIYFQHKHTDHPSVRACNVIGSECGEDYDYDIEKAWIVSAIEHPKHEMICVTPTGKRRIIHMNDTRIHRASPWERMRYNKKYKKAEEAELIHKGNNERKTI